jgi:hypothetical protein
VTDGPHIDPHAGDTLPAGTPLLQGQYLVEGFLNAGGFGITYLARDSLDRRVVIKECFPSTMCCRSDEMVRARSRSHQGEFDAVVRLFGQEARRLAKLEHPNIVGVRDVFEENGTAYMALDYIDGRDMLDVIEQETWRLDPDTVREITLQLLDAIGHVHARGMLHRDISPDNILLTADDTPILIDFGAARDTARRKSRLLSAMHVVKDGYSPQEFYLQGGEQSPASDLYSLAASLYHAITGDPPVYSHRRLAAIAERQPDPYRSLAGTAEGYDRRFLAMIDRAMEVFSRDRVHSAAEWMAGIAGTGGACPDAVAVDEAEIAERIRRLVEATNAEVEEVQRQRRREQEARARQAEIEEAEREAARIRRLEMARREAEEAERLYHAKLLRDSEGCADGASCRVGRAGAPGAGGANTAGPGADGCRADAAGLHVVAHVPGAGGVNRAALLKERYERARCEAEEEAARAAGKPEPGFEAGGKPTLLGRVLGGGRRRSKGISKVEGYGT